MNPGKVYGCSNLYPKYFDLYKILKIHEQILLNPGTFFNSKRGWGPQLQVKIEDGRKAS